MKRSARPKYTNGLPSFHTYGQRANAAASSPAAPAAEHDSLPELPDVPLEEYLEGIERRAIMRALELERWNRTAAAKRLGMTFRSLRYRLKKLGID